MILRCLHACKMQGCAAGTKVDGRALEAGSYVDLKDGEEIVFEDGKRYTVRYSGMHTLLASICDELNPKMSLISHCQCMSISQ